MARGDADLAMGENASAVADYRRAAMTLDRNLIVNYPGVAAKLARLGALP